MSADSESLGSDSDAIPISEWPVSSTEETTDKSSDLRESSKCRKRKTFMANDQSLFKKAGKSEFNSKVYNNSNQTILPTNTNIDSCDSSKPMLVRPQTPDAPNKEHPIAVKIAKWWRQTRSKGFCHDIPKCGPNSMLYHISRFPECQSFLRRERKRLLSLLDRSFDKADICAALASLDDFIGDFSSANKYIQQAFLLSPNGAEYRWLRTKISKQCNLLEEQRKAKKHIEGRTLEFPTICEVPRVSGKDFNPSEFKRQYIDAGKPVIITDVVGGMTEIPFDYSLVIEHAGKTTVTTKEEVSDSLAWAKLESKRETTIAELIRGVQSGSVNDCIFDWSLPLHCPSLAEQISLPLYFKNNFLLQTAPGSLYKDSWPSLFIAPKGATTQMHVDAFHSHFWMALFQGKKRWTFFDKKDMPFLYPRLFQSMDPVFEVDMDLPDLIKFPLLALTRPQQCVLQPGELLFVPAGSPHYVENLTNTLAISSNYVDQSNFDKVCEELEINALQDQRAHDLLLQLQDPAFYQRVTK